MSQLLARLRARLFGGHTSSTTGDRVRTGGSRAAALTQLLHETRDLTLHYPDNHPDAQLRGRPRPTKRWRDGFDVADPAIVRLPNREERRPKSIDAARRAGER